MKTENIEIVSQFEKIDRVNNQGKIFCIQDVVIGINMFCKITFLLINMMTLNKHLYIYPIRVTKNTAIKN